jgi:mono/diheme cytochrome c family protein
MPTLADGGCSDILLMLQGNAEMMRMRNTLYSLGVFILLCSHAAVDAAPPAGKPTFAKDVAPLINQYCGKCHSDKKPKGGVALTVFTDDASALKKRTVWEQVADNLRSGDMPPPGKPRPNADELDIINAWLDAVVFQMDCNGPRDPGRVTIRRLNRAEYNNTVRDLLGISFQPANDFPQDDVGYGFDNIGDVLSLPPLLMEKYLAAAEKIVEKVFANPESRKRIFIVTTQNEESARQILERFAGRAYRRPINREELQRLLRFVEMAEKNGDSFETGISLAVQAVLISPNFLFRVEMDPRPNDPKSIRTLTDYELASRLSYFLWSSMPDDELFELARKKTLRQPDTLEKQIRRMLQDPRSRALVENFAGQWLQLRNLKDFKPDPDLFPHFDEKLRSAMLKETELFFENVIRTDRSILDFIDADYTFVNERLAKHYGLSGVRGEEFRRVSLTATPRGGILTQAAVLSVTSNPTRTSPVKRGKWILENILGTPPPPPPPGVEELKDDKQAVLSGSLRQRMEQHRANPSCASCHQRMDPLGFGFENFDAIGAWRSRDGTHAIDPSGALPNGQSFKGPSELRAILKTRQDAFARCLTEKLLTYALGRGVERYDRCTIDDIVKSAAKDNYKFSPLVIDIVRSDPFQKRRGKGDKK